jgi:hypothetical protein
MVHFTLLWSHSEQRVELARFACHLRRSLWFKQQIFIFGGLLWVFALID